MVWELGREEDRGNLTRQPPPPWLASARQEIQLQEDIRGICYFSQTHAGMLEGKQAPSPPLGPRRQP